MMILNNKGNAIVRRDWEPRDAAVKCKFRYVSKFTAASRGFSVTTRLSYIGLRQRHFKCWNYTKYADFHGRKAKSQR